MNTDGPLSHLTPIFARGTLVVMQERIRILILILGLAASSLAVTAQRPPDLIDSISGSIPLHSWVASKGDDMARALPDFDASGWSPIENRSTIDVSDSEGWFWLRNEFILERYSGQDPLFLYFGRYPAPAEVYINGTLVGTRGAMPPRYFVQISEPFSVLIPESLVKRGEPTVIAVRSCFNGSFFNVHEIFLADRDFFDSTIVLQDILNHRVYYLFTAISLFAGIFYFVQFLCRRKDSSNALYAASCLFITVYFYEMGTPRAFFTEWWFRIFAKACLNLSLGALCWFFLEYFAHKRKAFALFIILSLAAISTVLLMSASNSTVLDDFFNYSLVITILDMGFCLYAITRAVAAGNKSAIPILLGAAIGVGTGVYDSISLISGNEPFAYLQGMGFFCFDLSIFFVLAARLAGAFNSLETYAKEIELKSKTLENTNKAFSRFIPVEFLDILGQKNIFEIKLGDQVMRKMTILFCDIREFAALSERLTTEQNFNFLNNFLKRMSPIIREEGGIIDKYVGDSIMALFPDNPENALKAALKMRDALDGYNEGRKRAGYTPVDFGMGIHTGNLILGTIGEEHRMDSTVISDAVNVASRLQGLTRSFGIPVIVSGQTLEEIKDVRNAHAIRYLGLVKMKGKEITIPAYEMMTETDEVSKLKLKYRDRFEQAVFMYDLGEEGKAEAIFGELETKIPGDPLVTRYLTMRKTADETTNESA